MSANLHLVQVREDEGNHIPDLAIIRGEGLRETQPYISRIPGPSDIGGVGSLSTGYWSSFRECDSLKYTRRIY